MTLGPIEDVHRPEGAANRVLFSSPTSERLSGGAASQESKTRGSYTTLRGYMGYKGGYT